MPERAKVHSLEVIENFRASLIIYLEKCRAALDDMSDDVLRTRVWVQDEQRLHWETQIKRLTRDLERKQAALFDAKLSLLQRSGQLEAAEAHQARRKLDEANNQLAVVKKWSKQYDTRVLPLAKDIDKLRDILLQHMGKAVVHLAQVIRAVAAYTDTARTAEANPPPSGTEGTSR